MVRSTHDERRERRIYDRARRALRREAAEAGAPCGICGHAIDYEVGDTHPAGFTAHHIVPRVQGGTTEDGLVPSHSGCNKAVREGRKPQMRTPGDRSASW